MQLRFSTEFEKSSYLDLIELQDKYGLQDKYNVSTKIMQSTTTKKINVLFTDKSYNIDSY